MARSLLRWPTTRVARRMSLRRIMLVIAGAERPEHPGYWKGAAHVVRPQCGGATWLTTNSSLLWFTRRKRELDHAADDLVAVKPLRRGARLAERRSAAQRPAASRRGKRPGG